MKKTIPLILLGAWLFQSACVSSLHPLVTYDIATRDDRISGTWASHDQVYSVQPFYQSDFFRAYSTGILAEKENKTRTEKDIQDSILLSRSYIISYIKDSIQYQLLGSLVPLDANLFMNFTAVNAQEVGETDSDKSFDPHSSLNTNTVARVRILSGSSLVLDFIDGGFIYDQVKAGRLRIKHEKDELYDGFLVTASSADLQQFLRKYGNDPRLYNKEYSVILKRK